ncbi:hypothetical protein ACFL0Q_08720 [Thermodesulfobacteriota bacterium]
MSFGDKKALLHWLFEGKDKDGSPYGIYVNRQGKGQGAKIDYFLYGRITGLRTAKGDDIDWDSNALIAPESLQHNANLFLG